MKYTKVGINTNFMRLFRIQISSKERNKNLYPDHFYDIKVNIHNIGYPYSHTYAKTFKLRYFTYTDDVFFTNCRQFYYKKTTDGDNVYIDFGVPIPQYSSVATVEVETVNEGSVTWLFDNAEQNEYTQVDPVVTNNAIMLNCALSFWTNINASRVFRMTKGNQKITDAINNEVAFVMSDGTIYNDDNNSFTATLTSSDTYSQTITVSCKRPCVLIAENMNSI